MHHLTFQVILIIGLFLWIWIILCYPKISLYILLFSIVLLYSRLSIGISTNGSGLQNLAGRGFVSIDDFLWAGFIIFFLPTILRIWKPTIYRIPVIAINIFLYGILVIMMPFLSVLHGMPSIYILSAIHPMEWLSFVLIGYVFAKQYSLTDILCGFTIVVSVSSIIHFAYSVLQMAVFMSLLPEKFLFLDQIYERAHGIVSLSYSRCTGLFVNPNSYGVFSALVSVIVISIIIFDKTRKKHLLWIVSFFTSVGGIILSGSRAGLLSLSFALIAIFMVAASLHNSIVIKRIFKGIVSALVITIFIFIFISVVSPYYLKFLSARFYKIFMIAQGQIYLSPNAVGRLNMWHSVWESYINKYPFGTWAPPSYILHLAMDSYYITSLSQGTMIFTFSFVVFLFATLWLGIRLLKKNNSQINILGSVLVGFSVIFGIASISMSPSLEPFLIIPFWFIIGMGLAKRNCYIW